jgi:hypothetical protein
MTAPTITALTAVPSAPATYSADYDAFNAAIVTMASEMNTLADYRAIHDPIVEIDGLAAASIAAQSGEPAIWVTGTTYARGDVRWSPTNYLDYVRLTAGAGSTDPATDSTNWQLVTGTGDSTLTGVETYTNKTLKDPAYRGAVTEEVYTIEDAAGVPIAPANGSIQIWEVGANRTPTLGTWADGQEIALLVYGGGWTVTWSSVCTNWDNGITPTLTIERYAWITLKKRGGAIEGKYIGQTAPGYLTLDLNFLVSETLDSRITFTRASSGTYVNSSGNVATASIDVARFDYDPVTLAANAVLREEQRTNICLWNRDLTNPAWTATNCTTAKTATGADGVGNSATTLTATAGNATVLQAITSGSAARVTSCRIKRRTGTGNIQMTQDNGATWTTVTVTSGWTRVSIAAQTLTNPTVGFRIVTSGDAIDVDYVQHEVGSFITSDIATTTATVTRSADFLSMTDSNFSSWFNQSEGTFVVDYNMLGLSGNTPIIHLDDNTANNYHRIMPYVGGINGKTFVGGVTQCDFVPAPPSVNANHKTAYAFKTNDFGMATDGGAVSTDTSGTGNPAVDRLYIGYGGALGFSGSIYIRRVRFFNTRRVNADLQTLTA